MITGGLAGGGWLPQCGKNIQEKFGKKKGKEEGMDRERMSKRIYVGKNSPILEHDEEL